MKTSRSGFTLVEILVVITIIGLVAAIALPAIGQALARARNAAIKTEIDMLHLAVMNYRNEYGSFPPSGTTGFAVSSTEPAVRHLLRLFPRMSTGTVNHQLQNTTYQNVGNTPAVTTGTIHPANALPLWLYGYTNDPTLPVLTGGTPPLPRAKMYDFDTARLSGTFSTYTPRMQYFAAGKPASPYIYIAAPYVTSTFSVISNGVTNNYFAQQVPLVTSGTVFNTPGQPFFNPDTFQILSAGRDEVFYTDDDISNFWPGTRQDYIDSLSN
jgi:prepilin-type N-terminal cleavage/methylation domain-containing protein